MLGDRRAVEMPEQVAGEDHVVPGGTEDAEAYFDRDGLGGINFLVTLARS